MNKNVMQISILAILLIILAIIFPKKKEAVLTISNPNPNLSSSNRESQSDIALKVQKKQSNLPSKSKKEPKYVDEFISEQVERMKAVNTIYSIADDLFFKLENENYIEVEQYFDNLISTKEKSLDGRHIIWPIYKNLSKKTDSYGLEVFNKWCEKSLHHSAYVTRAMYYIYTGWRARGYSYARDVPKDKFEIFQERLRLALDDLEIAHLKMSKDVSVHTAKLLAIRGLGRDNELRIKTFHDGQDIDPSFYWLYKQNLEYLLPKWGGSWDRAFNFCYSLFADSPTGSYAYSLILKLIEESRINSGGVEQFIIKSYSQYIDEIEKRYKIENPKADFIAISIEKLRGMDHFIERFSEKAEKNFKKIIEIDPNNDWAWYMLGQMYNKHMRGHEKALSYFDMAIELVDNSGLYYRERGYAAALANKNEQCIEDINLGENLGSPPGSYGYYLRAECFVDLGDIENAIKDYTLALNLLPDREDTCHYLLRRAALYSRLGRNDKAFQDITLLLEINPHHKLAQNSLKRYEQELKKQTI